MFHASRWLNNPRFYSLLDDGSHISLCHLYMCHMCWTSTGHSELSDTEIFYEGNMHVKSNFVSYMITLGGYMLKL